MHIADASRGKIPFDFALLAPLIDRLRADSRYPGSTFGVYADVVLAISSGEYASAVALLRDLTLERPVDRPPRVLAIDDPQHATHVGRYARLMGAEPASSFSLFAPAAALKAAFELRFRRARQLIASAMPELHVELEELVTDVIAVVGDREAKYQFDGGSSYMLWGSLFLNADSHHSDVAMVEVLAHESAHILLYALTADEALVDNRDEELFPSPLRHDLRPMDGIYHATFVSARMFWAMSALIDSGLLDQTARAEAERARREDRENFWSGHQVVEHRGKLTATGEAIMRAARQYMESPAASSGR